MKIGDWVMQNQFIVEDIAKALIIGFVCALTYIFKKLFGGINPKKPGQFIVKKDAVYLEKHRREESEQKVAGVFVPNRTNSFTTHKPDTSKRAIDREKYPWEGKKKRNNREDKF